MQLMTEPSLAEERDSWRSAGVFFEVLHKYKTVPEDRELVDLAFQAVKRLREAVAQFHDSSNSLRGLKTASLLASEAHTIFSESSAKLRAVQT
ncbi:unnamed protein product [Effrenium voratum]|nr:unnamed protein product [Effrenium voratum]